MPYVNIKITEEGTTDAQKQELIEKCTDLIVDVLGKNRATTIVVIEEVPMAAWGIGGKTVQELRGKNLDWHPGVEIHRGYQTR